MTPAFGFRDGAFDYATANGTFPGSGVPLGQPLFLRQIDLGLAANPLRLSGGARIAAGPKIAGTEAVALDGTFPLLLPSSGPVVFRADGTLSVVRFQVADAFAEYRTPGSFSFGGGFSHDFGPASATGKVAGWVDVTGGAWQATGSATLHFPVGSTGADVIVSSAGIAACGSVPVPKPTNPTQTVKVGFGQRWTQVVPTPIFSGCDVSGYTAGSASNERVKRESQVAATTTLPKGLGQVVFALDGAVGPPPALIVGPAGETITTPPQTSVVDGAFVVVSPTERRTYVAIPSPSAGVWRVDELDPANAVTSVRWARDIPRPRVTGTVRADGRARILSYRIRRIAGQRVRFVEVAGRVRRALRGPVRAGGGTLRFVPAPQGSRARRVVAVVEQNGLPRAEITVARFTAPPGVRLRAPRGLRISRRGERLVASWRPVPGARGYLVRIDAGDGRRLLRVLPRTRRVVRIASLGTENGARIRVAALGPQNRRGPWVRRATPRLRPLAILSASGRTRARAVLRVRARVTARGPVGVSVERRNGTVLTRTVRRGGPGVVSLRVRVPRAGRYRLVVRSGREVRSRALRVTAR